MKATRIIWILCFCILGLSSCKKGLSPEGFNAWLQNPDNGLVQDKQMGNYAFRLEYRPLELQAKMAEVEMEDLADYQDFAQFKLKVSNTATQKSIVQSVAHKSGDLQGATNYFAFNFKQDMKLVVDEVEVPCSEFIFERNYNLAPHNAFLIGFELPEGKEKSDLQVIIDSDVLAVGPIKFHFSKKDLQRIPKIK